MRRARGFTQCGTNAKTKVREEGSNKVGKARKGQGIQEDCRCRKENGRNGKDRVEQGRMIAPS